MIFHLICVVKFMFQTLGGGIESLQKNLGVGVGNEDYLNLKVNLEPKQENRIMKIMMDPLTFMIQIKK